MASIPTRRAPVGQLLVRMLRQFRVELYERRVAAGYRDLREAHMQVFGNIARGGSRLTDLAIRANMTRPSMAELVDDLADLGYLERRPDPTDGRAKLVCLTAQGEQAVRGALRDVSAMERAYAQLVGRDRFEAMCQTMQDLIDRLERRVREEGGPTAGSAQTRSN